MILDKSGSMESIRTEAINGYNETLGSIKATQLKFLETQEHFVSLAAFCDCGIDIIFEVYVNRICKEAHPESQVHINVYIKRNEK